MCTIFTCDNKTFYKNKQTMTEFRNRIWKDAQTNDDGQSLVMIYDGAVTAQLRSMDPQLIIDLIDMAEWDRIFVHSRLATQGEVALHNTHGWFAQGVYYMHNGFISAAEANLYEVDSQAIGHWLRRGGVTNALGQLRKENYANVLMIDPSEWSYYMSRSRSGSLYTDGEGNFSTNAIGVISDKVKDCTQEIFELPPLRPRKQETPAAPAAQAATVVETKPAEETKQAAGGETTTIISPTAEVTKPEVSPTAEGRDEWSSYWDY
jgi:hypothetical protein